MGYFGCRLGMSLAVLVCAGLGSGQAREGPDATGAVDPVSLYCLCIGISDYEMGKPSGSLERGALRDLTHASNDAAGFRQSMLDCGVPEANIRMLANSAATKAGIVDGLQWLVDNSDTASGLVFYFSGHGSDSIPDVDGDEWEQRAGDRFDEALIPYDALDLSQYDKREMLANPERMKELYATSIDRMLIDDEIFSYLCQVDTPFYFILDSCFSGGAYREASPGGDNCIHLMPKSPDTAVKDARGVDSRLIPAYWVEALLPEFESLPTPSAGAKLDLPGHVTMLAASTESQTSLELDRGGVFTSFLLEALNDGDARQLADTNKDAWVDLGEAFVYARNQVDDFTMELAISMGDDGLYQQPCSVHLEMAGNLRLAEVD